MLWDQQKFMVRQEPQGGIITNVDSAADACVVAQALAIHSHREVDVCRITDTDDDHAADVICRFNKGGDAVRMDNTESLAKDAE